MASKYIQKYPVPQGFPDILHDFAREVLRDQPENIYEFGYLYFKAMEEVRFIQICLIIMSYQGKPFEFGHKGKHIPPPKDRQPEHHDYHHIQAVSIEHVDTTSCY